jgi:GTP-binding protein
MRISIRNPQSAMKVTATFVRSVADAAGVPQDRLAELALVGRSNVGKSSLINALVRLRIARTSAAPGKTRLANVYRVARGSARSFYLVDLPGYGFTRGGREAARVFDEVTQAYFGRAGPVGPVGRIGRTNPPAPPALPAPPARTIAALLLVDARHPGLESDVAAWRWLRDAVDETAIVATKVDKLARGARMRALREFESVHEYPVLPVSAVTGEGLDDLWRLIDKLLTSG